MAALGLDLQDRQALGQRRVEELVVLFLKGDSLQPLQGQQSEASLHNRTQQHNTTQHNTTGQQHTTTQTHTHTAACQWGKRATSVRVPLGCDHQVPFS